jgi:hypothetical protein
VGIAELAVGGSVGAASVADDTAALTDDDDAPPHACSRNSQPTSGLRLAQNLSCRKKFGDGAELLWLKQSSNSTGCGRHRIFHGKKSIVGANACVF